MMTKDEAIAILKKNMTAKCNKEYQSAFENALELLESNRYAEALDEINDEEEVCPFVSPDVIDFLEVAKNAIRAKIQISCVDGLSVLDSRKDGELEKVVLFPAETNFATPEGQTVMREEMNKFLQEFVSKHLNIKIEMLDQKKGKV